MNNSKNPKNWNNTLIIFLNQNKIRKEMNNTSLNFGNFEMYSKLGISNLKFSFDIKIKENFNDFKYLLIKYFQKKILLFQIFSSKNKYFPKVNILIFQILSFEINISKRETNIISNTFN
jgi:hypothetical protein